MTQFLVMHGVIQNSPMLIAENTFSTVNETGRTRVPISQAKRAFFPPIRRFRVKVDDRFGYLSGDFDLENGQMEKNHRRDVSVMIYIYRYPYTDIIVLWRRPSRRGDRWGK
jgi:hypothetical protein